MRFALILLVTTIASAQETGIRNPHTTPADVAAGAKIFRSHCGECHGLKGEGGRGPNLTSGVFFHGNTDADLIQNISDGIPGTAMPGVFFSPDQVWQIIAYVRSLARSGSMNRPPGDPAQGAKLFREKACLGCHLLRGEGGLKGPDLSTIGSQRSVERLRQSILEPDAEAPRENWVAKITLENGSTYSGFLMNEDTYLVQVLDFSKGLRTLPKHDFRKYDIEKSPIMPSYRGRLSGSEVDDLVAYLWSLKRQGRRE